MPAGTKRTWSRPSSPITCSAMTMCPWWMGSKVPPKIPTFTAELSPEVEHRPADPDLVARLRARAPQGAHDPAPLELALEALNALRVLPIRLQGQPLDVLAGDDVAAVLPLHPHTFPRRPEHAVRSLLYAVLGAVAQLAQPLLEEIHLVEHRERRLFGEARGVQLGQQGGVGPLRVLAGVEDERQEPRPRDVAQETVPEAPTLARARDQARDVRDHERFAVAPVVRHPKLRRERGERVVAYPRMGSAKGSQQRRLACVRQPDEAHIREDPELEPDLTLLPRQSLLPKGGRLAGRGREGGVPPAALAAAGDDEGCPGLGEVGERAALVVDQGADRYLEDGVFPTLAGAVVAGAMTAALCLQYPAVRVGFEGGEVLGSAQDHRPAVTAAAAIRAAARLVLLAVKGDAAVAAATCADDEPGFIYELQWG